MSFQARIFDFLAALDQAARELGVQITAKGAGIRRWTRMRSLHGAHRMVEKWDVWVEKPPPHLPCKLVSGDVDDPAATSQVNEFTWKKAPNFDADTFIFSPPPGSQKIDIGDLLAGAQ